jgi:DNA-binding MarR family transcriptional regulator/predicted RNA-binding Zn-ribbon protein involved in translation (DUF1610 family)
VAELQGGDIDRQPLKLTVKEKVLLELRLHMCEDGLGEYPIELTQKGLSECLGVRRSHIALSLQGLVEDKLVDVRKERIEGEGRKQNIYTLTPTGHDKAKEVTVKVLSTEADFEMLDGVKHVSTEDFLKISKADLSSVVRQLERGSVIRDEITIITRPERKLITVYCPTCKRNLEVENTYANETVSFDCPGCGRPYKIAPDEKVTIQKTGVIDNSWPLVVAIIAFFGAIIGWRALDISPFCSSIVVLTAVALSLGVYMIARPRSERSRPRRRIAAMISLVAIVLGYGLVLIWGLLISRVDLAEILLWYMPLVAGVMLGYLGLAKVAPDLTQEYLLILGAFFALLAISLVSVRLGELSQSSAPFIGVLGIALAVIASTSLIDRNIWILDLLMAGGSFILLMAFGELVPGVGSVIGWIAIGGLVLLGAVMVSLRPLQRKTDRPIGHIFVSALPFAVGALFLMTGVLMIDGGSTTAGVIEIALMAPFIYYGLRKVFDGEWMYRLPVASLLVSVEVLSITYAFMS